MKMALLSNSASEPATWNKLHLAAQFLNLIVLQLSFEKVDERCCHPQLYMV